VRSVCFWSFLSAPERLCVVVEGRFCDVVGGGAGRGADGATTEEEGARGGASGARSVGGRRVHCSSAPGRGGSADSAPASGSEDGSVDVVAVAAALGWFARPRRSVVVFVFAGAAVEDAFFVLRAGELGNKASVSSVRRFPAALSALISSLNSLICFFCRSHVARSDLSSFAEAAFVASSADRAVPGNPPDANLALTSASRSARSRITSAVALFNLSISASARIRLKRSSLAVRRSNADSVVPFDAADAARPRRPNASVPPHASSNDSYRDFSVINASRSESRTLSLSSNRRKSSVVAVDVDAFSCPAPLSSPELSSSSSSSFSPASAAAAAAAAFIANLAAIAAAGLVDVARRFFAILNHDGDRTRAIVTQASNEHTLFLYIAKP
jgi:hypothetical protein